MELRKRKYSISTIGILLALTCSEYAHALEPVISSPGKIYLGIFGGIGASNKIDVSQYGTAFFEEEVGGPLAVDAFGKADTDTVGLIGARIGYQLMEIFPNPCNSWSLAPAVEWEGYYLGKNTIKGNAIDNDTTRLPEHNFLATYPMSTGVFLANAVIYINPSCISRFHPYVGVGIGGSVLSISNADAEQLSPPEAGVNHYNANPSDKDSTFAAQAKAGLNFDLNKNVSLFVEYRWLYLSSSNFAFGSTVFPGHVATTSWDVKFDPQHYNIGTIGIQFSI